ncbi:hypothetical protein EDB92DRAFT_1818997 [Lactarius akahatsu]|uniref:Uncharacterized protein n=1 Tax=Lactarius akahatsu TaxID=416441 RepID=A0AAD4LB73_9AGAM|nr:hypothetical protein EDB92DRAFT_1818997 [Lactarius akahatsu]
MTITKGSSPLSPPWAPELLTSDIQIQTPVSLWEAAPETAWVEARGTSGEARNGLTRISATPSDAGRRMPYVGAGAVAAKDKEKEGRGTTLIESHLGKVKRGWLLSRKIGRLAMVGGVGAGSDTSTTASGSGVKARERARGRRNTTQRVFVRRLPPFLSVIGWVTGNCSASVTRRALTIRRTTQKGMVGVFLSSSIGWTFVVRGPYCDRGLMLAQQKQKQGGCSSLRSDKRDLQAQD